MRELLERIDARELAEWRILEGLDPWGATRDDVLSGRICQTIAATSPTAPAGRVYRITEFMPQPIAPAVEYQTSDEIESFFRSLASKSKKGKP